ncbi:ferredoxin reductase [Candidatus Saccharibacteria bacterium oral taxon 488]|nr:ferredoxin reductase [Candidatus Saccharibacteria bacterium oral taxon 488]
MKRSKKMVIIVISILAATGLIAWGVIAYLGRGQTLSVKSIENPSGDLHVIHLAKPDNMTWKAGSYAKITLPSTASDGEKNDHKGEQTSRWLSIASSPEDNEIIILTHNSGSPYKKALTSLPAGSQVKMSWLESSLSVTDGNEPLVCFASDVGISAIRPIVRQWAGKRPIMLYHLDKGVKVFDKELSELANKTANMTYETSANLSQSQERFKQAIDRHGNKAQYLVAGQPDDVKTMKKLLGDNAMYDNVKSSTFRGLK